MRDPASGPAGESRIFTPDDEEYRLSRVRDLELSIQHAALGHAAALYELRVHDLLDAYPPKEGYGVKVRRFTTAGCPGCRGSGIKYEATKTEPVRSYHADPFTAPPPASHPMITIKECSCVRYEAQYVKQPEPTEAAIVVPPEQLRTRKATR